MNQTESLKMEERLDAAIPDSVKELIMNDLPESDLSSDAVELVNIDFIKYSLLLYKIDNKYYVDINHLISKITLDWPTHQVILTNYSNLIDRSIFDIDANCQVINRNLINIDTMAKILTENNCKYSELFRLEIITYLITVFIFVNYAIYCS